MNRYILAILISSLLSLQACSDGVNDPDLYGNLPLGQAATKGDFESCKKLVGQGAQVAASNDRGKTALHLAACQGHFDICVFLVDRGAPINVLDVDGETALHYAAEGGYADVCELLRARGADASIKGTYRGTPLEIAQRYNEDGSHSAVIGCLLKDAKHGDKPSIGTATRRADDCGDVNDASCTAQPGLVTWAIDNRAWKNFKAPDANCKIENQAWVCQWKNSSPDTNYLATAPCLNFQKGQAWTVQLEIAFDLSAPEPARGLAEYPAFAIVVGLISANTNEPLVVERFDLSKMGHSQWRWQMQKKVVLSVATHALADDLKCAHVAVWGANRLRGSELEGSVEIKNAAIVIAYDHPKPNWSHVVAASYVPVREDLLSCRQNAATPNEPNSGYVTGCFLKEGLIQGSQTRYSKQVIFHVDYTHTCTGTPLAVGICVGEDQKAEFVSDGSQRSVELIGHGPFEFRDFNGAAYTAKAILRNPCTIRISGFHVRPLTEQAGH